MLRSIFKDRKIIWNISIGLLILFNVYYFTIRKHDQIIQYISKQFYKAEDPILKIKLYQDLSEEYFYLNKKYENRRVIVFIGDSITKRFNVSEYFESNCILNRGIPFDTTYGLKKRLNRNINNLKIEKIFIMIGVNDLPYRSNNEIITNISNILSQIRSKKIIIQSILPVDSRMIENNARIVKLNDELRNLCLQNKYIYIDLHSRLLDKRNGLSSKYSRDGVHLNRNGNLVWSDMVKSLLVNSNGGSIL